MRTIGETIQAEATRRGWTVTDLARHLPHVSRSTVSHWWHGRRKPLVENLRRLSEVLEISVARLVGEDPDYTHTPEEKLLLQTFREMTPERQEAYLAFMKAK